MEDVIVTVQGTIEGITFIDDAPHSLIVRVILKAEQTKHTLFFLGDLAHVFIKNIKKQPRLGETFLEAGCRIRLKGALRYYDKHGQVNKNKSSNAVCVTEILTTTPKKVVELEGLITCIEELRDEEGYSVMKVTVYSDQTHHTLFFTGQFIECFRRACEGSNVHTADTPLIVGMYIRVIGEPVYCDDKGVLKVNQKTNAVHVCAMPWSWSPFSL